jgi:hypothetical protein
MAKAIASELRDHLEVVSTSEQKVAEAANG